MDASNRSLGLGHQAGALQPLAPQKPGFVTGGVGPQEAKLREELHAFLARTSLMQKLRFFAELIPTISEPGTLQHKAPLRKAEFRDQNEAYRRKVYEAALAAPSGLLNADLGLAEEARRLFGWRGTNIESGAPLEAGNLGKLWHNLDVPVEVLVALLADR